jgi:hypothetical protein
VVEIHVFVGRSDATRAEDEKAIRLAHAAAKRWPDRASVIEHPLDDELALALGVEASPTVAVDDVVLAVGASIPAGRLVRFVQSQLGE